MKLEQKTIARELETRNAVETAIDLSKIHDGTWEENAAKYGKAIRKWPEYYNHQRVA